MKYTIYAYSANWDRERKESVAEFNDRAKAKIAAKALNNHYEFTAFKVLDDKGATVG